MFGGYPGGTAQLRSRPSRVSDADHGDGQEAAVNPDSPVSLEEAEEAVARAESHAEAARAHAATLRRQAEADSGDGAKADVPNPSSVGWRRWLRSPLRRLHPPSRKTVEVCAAAMVVVASLTASGYMVWQHVSLLREHKRATECAAAARRGVEMMMSIDPEHARENVQTLIDNTTGELQSQLRATSSGLVQDTQQAKVTTKATVQDVAVESITGDTGVVLVVAQSDTTNADKSKRPPVFWRMSVNLTRADGQLKMSRVDFIQ